MNLSGHGTSHAIDENGAYDEKKLRLIDWNADVLCRLLNQIVACRSLQRPEGAPTRQRDLSLLSQDNRSILSEVKEIVDLPGDSRPVGNLPQAQVDEEVASQLRNFVSCVCVMYRDNPFHNFEHAR